MTEQEQAIYEWQADVAGFSAEGQQRLKSARVLISRIGGVGGMVAMQLTMAGVGTLVLAHAGDLRENDLNRQALMSFESLGQPRVEQAARRLHQLNPFVKIETVNANCTPSNADELIARVDLVVSCAPLFSERLAMNAACVRQKKPLIDCAMYELEGQVLAVEPGHSACLRCLYPEEPPLWRRRFPVFGASAGMVGCVGAMEAIKRLAGFGERLQGKMLWSDLGEMAFRVMQIDRRSECADCGEIGK
jgi:molybdopterin/thiamine biosynthesis adenylyltransferase